MIEIPNDPLKMPPPYWRSSGSIFQLLSALKELCSALRELRERFDHINSLLDDYFSKNSESNEDDEEFGDICEPLWEIESKIKDKCDLSVFMAAISVEDSINMQCAFNLQRDTAESIEKLSPPEKLLILSNELTDASIKGSSPYAAIKKLTSWRNAYAHGHCTDRPTKTLRHNHLVSPSYYPTVPKEIESLLLQIDGYLSIDMYLRSISKNSYTSSSSCENEEIAEYIGEVKRYKFAYEENGEVYDFTYK